MKRFYYILSLLFVFIIPAAIAAYFVFDRIPLINFAVFVVGITVLGSIWDIWATRHGKRDPIWLWQFNFKDTLGIKLFDLPIEEYVFYIASSVYIIFLWEGIKFALETKSIVMYLLLPLLSIWSLLAISIPYILRVKNDRFKQ